MKPIFLFLLLALVHPGAFAQGPKLLVPHSMPGLIYPEGPLAAGESGSVRMLLKVSEFGEVLSVEAVESVKGSTDFVKAVRANLERWSFRREIKGACTSEASQGVAQIDFSVQDGKPRITALGRPDVEARLAEFQPRPAGQSFQAFVQSTYPARAVRERLAAAVAVAVDYEVTTGIPVAARAAQVSLSAAPPYPEAALEFSQAASGAMMRARYQAEAGKRGELAQACVVLQYVPREAS